MGACATKPKVSKGNEGEAPAPVPPHEPTKDAASAVPEAKEGADAVAEGEAVDVSEGVEVKEVVDDDKAADDQALLKENKKECSGSDNASASPELVQQESLETVEQESSEPVKQEPQEPEKQESVEEPVKTESPEPVKTEPSEPEKQAPSDAEELKEVHVTTNQESDKPAKQIEQTN